MKKITTILIFGFVSLSVSSSPMSTTELSIKKNMAANRIAGPISGVMGIVAPQKRALLIYKYQQLSKIDFYSGSELADNSKMKDYNYTIKNHTVGLRYGAAKRLELKLIGNFYKKDLEFSKVMMPKAGGRPGGGRPSGRSAMPTTGKTVLFEDSSSSIGDTMLSAKYQILSPLYDDSIFLSASMGVKLPTGANDLKNDNGDYLQWNLQNGTGSYDGILEVAMTKKTSRLRFDSGIRSFITTEGARGFKRGNKHILAASINTKVNKFINLGLSSNYKIIDKNSLTNIDMDNSGGKYLYLSPALSINVNKRAQLSMGASFLVDRDINGTNSAEDYIVESKMLLFF